MYPFLPTPFVPYPRLPLPLVPRPMDGGRRFTAQRFPMFYCPRGTKPSLCCAIGRVGRAGGDMNGFTDPLMGGIIILVQPTT